MTVEISLAYGEPQLVAVGADRLYVVALVAYSDGENAARFRYVYGRGERDHFPVAGIALLELAYDGTELARHPDLLVHHVVRGAVGVFWHGPPRPGIHTHMIGAHGWDIASGRKLWSFPGGLVALGERLALGNTGEKARAIAYGHRYAIVEVASGAMRVELDGRELVAMTADDERAYVMDRGGPISAYRLADGAHLWTSTFAEYTEKPTLTSFGLALGDGCLWYASGAGAVGLDPATGSIAVAHAMKEYFTAVLTTERGAITVRETKIDWVARSGVTRIADLHLGDREATTNGRWLLVRAREGTSAKDLLVVAPDGSVSYLKLAIPASFAVLGDEHVAFRLDTSALVVTSLADLADPKKKTLTLPGGSAFAKRAPLPKLAASAAATRLADALTAAGLMPEMPKAERTLVLLDLFGRDAIPESGAATLLQAVSRDDSALDRGFLTHDWRFGQETSDVIAEFDRALRGGPIRFEQTRNDRTGLAMRVTHGATVEEVSFPGDVSLGDIADRIDAFLAEASSPKRIHGLETDGDWFAFLIVEDRVIASLRAAKVKGIA
jgi:hypothetical protein